MIRIIILLLMPSLLFSQSYLLKGKLKRRAFVSAEYTPPTPDNRIAFVTDHRWDADLTFSQNTDTRVATSTWYMEMRGFKANIRPGIYSERSQYNTNLLAQEQTGLVRNDYYVRAQSWKHPIAGNFALIPDNTSTTWTAAGEEVFNVTAGTSKTNNYPDQGQDLFDVSGGDYGFDFTTNTMGASNLAEFYDYMAFEYGSVTTTLGGRKPAAMAFSLGKTDMKTMLMTFSLGNRNTSPGIAGNDIEFTITDNGNSFYGISYTTGDKLGFGYQNTFTREYWNNYPGTLRWYDAWDDAGFTREQMDDYVHKQIDTGLLYKGWVNDFGHWHEARTDGRLDIFGDFYDSCRTWFGSAFVWTCSPGEAIEYMFARQCVDTINVIEQGDSIIIDAVYLDPFSGLTINTFPQDIPVDRLNTPVTIKINLSETALAGKTIECSYGKVVSKGSDIWLLQVPVNSSTGQFDSVSIKEAVDNSDVLDTDVPVILSANIVGTTLTVTTDIPTRAALFSVASGGADIDFVNSARSNTLTTSHVFTVAAGNDYHVGVISEFGMSTLSSKINN